MKSLVVLAVSVAVSVLGAPSWQQVPYYSQPYSLPYLPSRQASVNVYDYTDYNAIKHFAPPPQQTFVQYQPARVVYQQAAPPPPPRPTYTHAPPPPRPTYTQVVPAPRPPPVQSYNRPAVAPPVYRPIPQQVPSYAPIVASAPPVEYRQSQYHSQDEIGQYSYGHSSPGQTHSASKDIYGRVTGSYSYIDANGKEVIAKYVADENGFQVASNALPVAPEFNGKANLETVKNTPEVQAARDEHLKEVEKQKALIAESAAAVATPEGEAGNDDAAAAGSYAQASEGDAV